MSPASKILVPVPLLLLAASAAHAAGDAAEWAAQAMNRCQDRDTKAAVTCAIVALQDDRAGPAGKMAAAGCLRIDDQNGEGRLIDLRNWQPSSDAFECIRAGLERLRFQAPKDAAGLQKFGIDLGQDICTRTSSTARMTRCFDGILASKGFRDARFVDGHWFLPTAKYGDYCRHTTESVLEDPEIVKKYEVSPRSTLEVVQSLVGSFPNPPARKEEFDWDVLSRLRTCRQNAFNALKSDIDQRAARAARAVDPKAIAEDQRLRQKQAQLEADRSWRRKIAERQAKREDERRRRSWRAEWEKTQREKIEAQRKQNAAEQEEERRLRDDVKKRLAPPPARKSVAVASEPVKVLRETGTAEQPPVPMTTDVAE
jgi:hypothetical protein